MRIVNSIRRWNAGQLTLVIDVSVPIADGHDLEDRSFVAIVQDVKGVAQITVSLSLTWSALEQREPTFSDIPHLGDTQPASSLSELHWNSLPAFQSANFES